MAMAITAIVEDWVASINKNRKITQKGTMGVIFILLMAGCFILAAEVSLYFLFGGLLFLFLAYLVARDLRFAQVDMRSILDMPVPDTVFNLISESKDVPEALKTIIGRRLLQGDEGISFRSLLVTEGNFYRPGKKENEVTIGRDKLKALAKNMAE